MALDGLDIDFFLSVDGTTGDAQPDPNDSLGGARSSARLDAREDTVSASANDAELDAPTFSAGPDPTGSYLLFVNGGLFLEFRKIIGWDQGNSRVFFEHPFSGTPAGGFRTYLPNNLFSDMDATESSGGGTRYRAIFVQNNTGVSLGSYRMYLRPAIPGPIDFNLAVGNPNFLNKNPVISVIADEFTAPDLSSDAQFTTTAVAFGDPLGPDGSFPPGTNSLDNTPMSRAVWLRSVISGINYGIEDTVHLLVLAASNTGGDPDPIGSAALIVFGAAGYTPDIQVAPDRKPRIAGGSLLETRITALETGLGVPDQTVTHSVTSGPGSIEQGDPGLTDEDGDNRASYISSADPLDAGASVEITTEA